MDFKENFFELEENVKRISKYCYSRYWFLLCDNKLLKFPCMKLVMKSNEECLSCNLYFVLYKQITFLPSSEYLS